MTIPLLAAQTRFARDDWSGIYAFTVTAYSIAPTLTTPGTPLNITGWSANGTLAPTVPANGGYGSMQMTGTIVDGINGVFSLTLPASQTPQQAQGDTDTDPAFRVRARLVDPMGRIATIAIIPVFVY